MGRTGNTSTVQEGETRRLQAPHYKPHNDMTIMGVSIEMVKGHDCGKASREKRK